MKRWAIISLLAMTAFFTYLSFEELLKDHHDQTESDREGQQQQDRAEQQYQCGLAYPRSIRCVENNL